ncbi:CdaR family transcriptional regulator [uncultured Pseudokineococcus sp.]|uniref:PucR family transcriptional regulator n=1 Tax=uncultured Pseudokineococcus sp. TaxID=1642928 RepID=UPI002613BE52|nr:helix-turn-helix domain-containing protein [uncultured Pseudokineococcus sp.]
MDEGAPARARSRRTEPSADDVARLRAATGVLSTAALRHLDETLPWYGAMPAQDRSWVGLVAQAGIGAFTTWYSDPDSPLAITADVFGSAPRELTRAVTLAQTLELLRAAVDVVEDHVDVVAAPGREQHLREAVLRYSREVAFAAARLYAGAAEARGAWDARLEALVVDAVVRGDVDDAVRSRLSALGWGRPAVVTVVVGSTPAGSPEDVVARLRRAARATADDALVGLQGERLVLLLGLSARRRRTVDDAPQPSAGGGGPTLERAPAQGLATVDLREATSALAPLFGPGPVVVGPAVPDLASAGVSTRAALSGLASARAWPGVPRPVLADELWPERVLSGDVRARRALLDAVYRPLVGAGGALAQTVSTYLESGRSLEATARLMFVHPNTVRYRLRKAVDVTGWDATSARDALVLQVALVVGALADGPPQRAGEQHDGERRDGDQR